MNEKLQNYELLNFLKLVHFTNLKYI